MIDILRNSTDQTKQANKVDLAQGGNSGKPTDIACPKCFNILWEFEDEEMVYFRCCQEHIYSPKSLLAEQMTALKMAFWRELRSFKEKQAWPIEE